MRAPFRVFFFYKGAVLFWGPNKGLQFIELPTWFYGDVGLRGFRAYRFSKKLLRDSALGGSFGDLWPRSLDFSEAAGQTELWGFVRNIGSFTFREDL